MNENEIKIGGNNATNVFQTDRMLHLGMVGSFLAMLGRVCTFVHKSLYPFHDMKFTFTESFYLHYMGNT